MNGYKGGPGQFVDGAKVTEGQAGDKIERG